MGSPDPEDRKSADTWHAKRGWGREIKEQFLFNPISAKVSLSGSVE